MLNDRSDRQDEHEESEYHFSDDDVSYEVEPETAKSVSSEPKESILARLTRSKRMLISLAVFLVLVFVVYKMVSPTASTSMPELAPVTPVADAGQQQAPSQPMNTAQQAMPAQPEMNSQSAPMAPNTQVQPGEPSMMPPGVSGQNNVGQPSAMVPPMPGQSAATQPAVAPQPAAQPASAQPAFPPIPVPAEQAAAPGQQPVVGMPAVIPVESSVNGYGPRQTAEQPVAAVAPITQVSASAGNVQLVNENAISQLQADFSQKLGEYAAQSKSMQDQMQSLNTRVANIESQLNQLVQTLTRQVQGTRAGAEPAAREPVVAEPKVTYSVQAIVPGRAWLKSESGDTVTVAEGDVIKDLGRVTKIDPYDGIVEVNTGSRIVSISYGNGN